MIEHTPTEEHGSHLMSGAPFLPLGDHMKAAEHAYRRIVKPGQYTCLRLDGRAFHTFTRGLARPYDTDLMAAMDATLLALCEEVPGVRLGYVESDEISLLLTDWHYGAGNDSNPSGIKRSETWMGGVEAKILSLSAACATLAFHKAVREFLPSKTELPALFDSRLWTFPATDSGHQEVANYLLWRQRDSIKNSVTMAALDAFGHKAIHGLNTTDKQERLREVGRPWEDLPSGFRLGRVAVRREQNGTASYVDKRTGETRTAHITRNPFVIEPAPNFAAHNPESLIAQVIPRAPIGATS